MGLFRTVFKEFRLFLRRYTLGQALIRYCKRALLLGWQWTHPLQQGRRLSRKELEALLRKPVRVVSSPYCMYVARLYARCLQRMGYTVELSSEREQEWGDNLYVMIAAQWFPTVPEHYIFVQLEQLESSTWYGVHFQRILETADALLDYNADNINFLRKRRRGKVPLHYVPVTILEQEKIQTEDTPKQYDVLFYGGMEPERRKNAIALLQRHFRVKVITNLFGETLHDELRSAKIIINIHNYDKALLETTRLYECLSLGLFVVSEDSSNSGDFPTLRENISWFAEGDWDGMIAVIGKWLEDDCAREQERQARYARAVKDAEDFERCFRACLDNHA